VKAERVLTLLRDAVSTLTGAGGIGWQLWTGHPDATAMLVCAALLGVPGIAGLWQLRPGAQPMPESSSPSPPASPPEPSPSPSTSSS
jgi:hypothetical protein